MAWRWASYVAMAALWCVSASAAPPDTATIAISTDVPLTFGTYVESRGGTVAIAPDGTRTVTGVVGIAADFAPALFTVSISSGNPRYFITLPTIATLSNSKGATMTIDSFRSLPSVTGSAQPPARMDQLSIGATLHVGAGQAAGEYRGAFQVTVNL